MVISNLISNGSIKKGILLVGDTILKTCSREDKSTYPLFGDAGSATGMEFDDLSEGLKFHMESVDFFVFHQANLFMNEKIRKKLKIPKEKVPYTLNDFGNTSSASIPLTIVNELGNKLKKGNRPCLF